MQQALGRSTASLRNSRAASQPRRRLHLERVRLCGHLSQQLPGVGLVEKDAVIERVLISEEDINCRVKELGR